MLNICFYISENYVVPKGTYFVFFMREIHIDKKYWGDDAKEFKPERFSEENMENINQNAYFPFSKGPRICPGYRYAWISMKVFLSKFLMKYKVTTDLKLEELEYQFIITTQLKQGFSLKVERR